MVQRSRDYQESIKRVPIQFTPTASTCTPPRSKHGMKAMNPKKTQAEPKKRGDDDADGCGSLDCYSIQSTFNLNQ